MGQLAVGIVLIIGGSFAESPAIVLLGLILVLVEGVHLWWARRGLTGVEYRRHLPRHHAVVGLPGRGHQVAPRVADGRRPGLRDQGHIALGEGFHQGGGALPPVAVVITGEGLADLVVSEQLAGGAGVFGGDEADLAEEPQRPQSDVFEVADGGGD